MTIIGLSKVKMGGFMRTALLEMSIEELARDLVRFNTVSRESSTVDMVNFIKPLLEEAGFQIVEYPYEEENLRKINLIAQKGKGEKCKLALAGHMDTMPIDIKNWQTSEDLVHPKIEDPWNLTRINKVQVRGENNNRRFIDAYFGAGITDMKLFLAIAMKAGAQIDEKKMKYPFSLVFTSDEEVGCVGARKLLAAKKYLAEWIVVGEPTAMTPVYAHKGYIYKIIDIYGEGGHSSDPKNGTSVVKLALPVLLEKLYELEDYLNKIQDQRFNPPFPTLNIGVVTTDEIKMESINGIRTNKIIKSAKNLIPGFCRLELDIRPLPGQEIKEINDVIKRIIKESLEKIDNQNIEIYQGYGRKASDPLETPLDSGLLQAIKEIRKNPEAKTACFNTEGGLYNASGSQSIIWGPGSIEQAHKAGEYVEARYLEPDVLEKYVNLITKICC
jgi:acetylornithine deacetylase